MTSWRHREGGDPPGGARLEHRRVHPVEGGQGGLALAAVSVDGKVSPEFLATLSEDEDILDARAVYFDG